MGTALPRTFATRSLKTTVLQLQEKNQRREGGVGSEFEHLGEFESVHETVSGQNQA
jgi:hypothetical protein